MNPEQLLKMYESILDTSNLGLTNYGTYGLNIEQLYKDYIESSIYDYEAPGLRYSLTDFEYNKKEKTLTKKEPSSNLPISTGGSRQLYSEYVYVNSHSSDRTVRFKYSTCIRGPLGDQAIYIVDLDYLTDNVFASSVENMTVHIIYV